jgi:hypothetical protein
VKQYVQHTVAGEITAVAFAENPEKFGITPPYLVLDTKDRIIPSDYYVKKGQLVSKGPKPTSRSVFDYSSESWFEPDFSPEEEAVLCEKLRSERNLLLASTDWTQVADAPVGQAAWATYRQALRDITSQEGFPHSVVWPNKPQ